MPWWPWVVYIIKKNSWALILCFSWWGIQKKLNGTRICHACNGPLQQVHVLGAKSCHHTFRVRTQGFSLLRKNYKCHSYAHKESCLNFWRSLCSGWVKRNEIVLKCYIMWQFWQAVSLIPPAKSVWHSVTKKWKGPHILFFSCCKLSYSIKYECTFFEKLTDEGQWRNKRLFPKSERVVQW